jgi:hypothetical protein
MLRYQATPLMVGHDATDALMLEIIVYLFRCIEVAKDGGMRSDDGNIPSISLQIFGNVPRSDTAGTAQWRKIPCQKQ